MDGEVPTQAAIKALEEMEDEELAEAPTMKALGSVDVPKDVYTDPVAAMSADPLFLDQVDPSEFDIPVEITPSVEKWVRYFNGPGRKYYARWMSRSTRYRPMMVKKLDAAGLPRDLVYLSMIESGYNAHAYSHAAAAGLWQFIPSTGRLYDMRVDWWVDDRRDPAKSTDAAIEYLSELNKMFDGDWYLAWAAYNGGPGRVRRSIKNSGTRDFWTIANGSWLHSETENYPPKIIAAAIIGHHPERYGFTDIDFKRELKYQTAKVEGSVELEVLSKAAGLSLDEFKYLNPGLRRWATPPEGYEVRVPASRKFLAQLQKVPHSKRLAYSRHKVERGETLSAIASRYGVTTQDISRASGLANVNRIYVGMELVIPRAGGAPPPPAKTSTASTAPAKRAVSSASSYTVASGDTLSQIGARYGVTTVQLQTWNTLSGTNISVGQVLKLQADKAPSVARTVKHTVKSGETLTGIASKYKVQLSTLQKDNGISNASHIQVGQVLTVRTSDRGWVEYTVKGGDSLGAISNRTGHTVSEIQSWNNLSGSVIHPGQTLKLRP